MSRHDQINLTSWVNSATSDGVTTDAERVRTWRAEVAKADRTLERYACARRRAATKATPRSPSLLTVDGAAALLKVPPATIWSWLTTGRLQNAGSVGAPVAIPRAAVERLKRSKNAPTRRITKGRRS